jgi:hypothetical protein
MTVGRTAIVSLFSSVALLALVDCNPFAAFAECDGSGERDVASGEVVAGVDVDERVASLLMPFTGELVWSQTGNHSALNAIWKRSESPARLEADCDGNFTGLGVPIELRVSSADSLLDSGQLLFTLALNPQGQVSSINPPSYFVDPNFSALKAAGEVPDAWISGYSPRVELVVSVPDLKPKDGEILVNVPTSATQSRQVSIGSITFQ